MNPLTLVAHAAEKPFLLYVGSIHHYLGALLAQHNDEGHGHSIYYLSRTMVRAKSNNIPVGKECLALVFAIQKI